jgi:C-terminal processing protease CtpA/Prc
LVTVFGVLGPVANAGAQNDPSAQRATAERRAAQQELDRLLAQEAAAREQLLAQERTAQREREQAQEQAQREREQAQEQAQREREQAQEQAQREREQAQRERERVREQQAAEREQARWESELERARAELEEAAREVARLSSELAAPIMRGAAERFRFVGRRAMLGVNPEDSERGVRIAGVSPNGPAAAAGLRTGDVIIAIDGAELAASGTQSPTALLLAQTRHVEPGEDVALRVLRDGEERDFMVQTRQAEPGEFFSLPRFNVDIDVPNPPLPPTGDWRGFNAWSRAFRSFNAWQTMQLVPLTAELGAYFGAERGILVVRAPAEEDFGLRDGDVILDIGGREPTTPEHAMRILTSFEPGETLRMTIMRRQRRETVELTLPGTDDSDSDNDSD